MNKRTTLPELPVVMIQHIQSYMSGKQAARTALLSKSWHSAWLTRPILDFDERDFFDHGGQRSLAEYATTTMQRYQDLGLNIESFKLRRYEHNSYLQLRDLIVEAMRLGADDVHVASPLTLPQPVLASQNLLRLSLTWCRVTDGSIVNISCSALKSLALNQVKFTSADVFYKILASCSASLEQLSVSHIPSLSLSRMRRYELHKLRRLSLFWVDVGSLFSSDFASRFPCLSDLSIHKCIGYTRIQIASCTSLQTISFKPLDGLWRAKFDVPNIRKFSYSGWGLPLKLSIKAEASREWEFDVSVLCDQLYDIKWFLKLKKYLTKYRLSRISLSVSLTKSVYKHLWFDDPEQEVEIEVVPKPLVVENLMVDGPSSYLSALLVRLFGICRPKFIAHCPDYEKGSLDFLCKRQSMFGQFGLKEVKAELLPSDASQTPANKQKIRYHLIWEEKEEEEEEEDR